MRILKFRIVLSYYPCPNPVTTWGYSALSYWSDVIISIQFPDFLNPKGPFTRAIFLILTHAIEWLSHRSIDLYSFAQMV